MILYYALGGGLGHITRAQALLYTLQIQKSEAVILSSPLSAGIAGSFYYTVVSAPHGFRMNADTCSIWIRQMFLRYRPEISFVDTFPAGLMGELYGCGFSTEWHYVSRIFRIAKYLETNRLNPASCQRFSTVWFTERLPLHDERLISSFAPVGRTIDLIDPPDNDACEPIQLRRIDRYWMIIHSGSPDEVSNLLLYARRKQILEGGLRPTLVLATDRSLNHMYLSQYHPMVIHCSRYPAFDLMDGAERIISACGANIMRQTQAVAYKHDFMPFERAFDDQFLRAVFRREDCVSALQV